VDELGLCVVSREGHRDDVEAKSRSPRLFFIDKHPSSAKDVCALAAVDGFEGMAALDAGSRPYLDEDAEIRFADDEVDLAFGPPPIANQDLVAELFEVVGGELLCSLTERRSPAERAISHDLAAGNGRRESRYWEGSLHVEAAAPVQAIGVCAPPGGRKSLQRQSF
jgi:hypothetical protein